MTCKTKAPDIIIPIDQDILYGRSDFSINHVGNVAFRTLMGCCLDEYMDLPKEQRVWKHCFLQAITSSILKSGGRFLRRQRGDEDWKEVDVDKAREKVGQELRNVMRYPHILEAFSLMKAVDDNTLQIPFRSAYNFDWPGIVRACRGELLRRGKLQESQNHEEERRAQDNKHDDSLESILEMTTKEPKLNERSRPPSRFSSLSIESNGSVEDLIDSIGTDEAYQ